MAKSFIFESYHFNRQTGVLSLKYQYDTYQFEEVMTFPNAPFVLTRDRLSALEPCLFLLHIAAGVSYYKAFGNPDIEISSGSLSHAQADFFNDFYAYGLAQFAVTNNLKLHFAFPFDDNKCAEPSSLSLKDDIFVPVGGGKDSCVTLTLLKENGFLPTTFSVNSAPSIEACKGISGFSDVTVTRKISPVLLENNARFLNGHVPITGIIAFILLVCAILYDKRYVAMSCESSANEGNFGNVNHQWSKSSAFESSFYRLTQAILPDFRYFSLLRPLTELHIARLFANKCADYFDVFTSCNRAFCLDTSKRLTHWCGHCDKCRFVFLILAPFMDKEKLIRIIGINPLDDANQLDAYKQLLGIEGVKPFECVGTVEECRFAFTSLKNLTEWKNDFIINELYDKVNISDVDEERRKLLSVQRSDLIPEEFLGCLKINES